MPEDSIIEEVRKIRHEIEAELGGDARAYYEHLKERQEEWRDRLARRPSQSKLPDRRCAVTGGDGEASPTRPADGGWVGR